MINKIKLKMIILSVYKIHNSLYKILCKDMSILFIHTKTFKTLKY